MARLDLSALGHGDAKLLTGGMALIAADMERKANVPRSNRLVFAIDWHLQMAILILVAFLLVLAGHLVVSTIIWRRFSAQVSGRGRVRMLLQLLGASVGTYVVMSAVAFPIAVVVAGSPPH